ncbi:MAG TPA: hypothetical protein VGH99_22605 [Pseudonocardia sp.]|jgi:hypothetical protein
MDRRRTSRLTGTCLAAAFLAVAVSACGSQSAPHPAPAAPAPSAAAPSPDAPPPELNQLRVAITAFSWLDNDPPGSASVNDPVLHKVAGGQGTYEDPITVSVPGSRGNLAYRPGTRFYLPSLRRYVMVEDSGAPVGPPGTSTHLSVWIDGRDGTAAEVNACEDKVTGSGTAAADLNPPPRLDVIPGPIFVRHVCNIPMTN